MVMNFVIKYQKSSQEVFRVSFVLDFDFEQKDYGREIDISYSNQVIIEEGITVISS